MREEGSEVAKTRTIQLCSEAKARVDVETIRRLYSDGK